MRARRREFGGYSLLLCAGLAFIFVAPDEGRNPGAPSAPALDVAPAQAMTPVPRRHVVLPSDRVMIASADILGGMQAPDVWSTPLPGDEPPPAGEETPVRIAEAPTPAPALEAPAVAAVIPALAAAADPSEEPPVPTMLFEHASLIDQAVPMDSGRARAATAAMSPAGPTVTSALPPLTLRTISGKWAPHASACTDRGKRTAFLPLTLDERGARAGGATCSFRRTDQDGNRWNVAATCTDANESWNANVRLVLKGQKLTWSSERGTQVYVRCR